MVTSQGKQKQGNKTRKTVQWKRKNLFNKWCWGNWTAINRRMKLGYSFPPYTKINSKWMKDLKMSQESIKILEEKMGSNLFDISHSNFFQDMSPKAKETKVKKLLGLHQDQKLLHSKGNSQQNKEATMEWEKIFANDTTKG